MTHQQYGIHFNRVSVVYHSNGYTQYAVHAFDEHRCVIMTDVPHPLNGHVSHGGTTGAPRIDETPAPGFLSDNPEEFFLQILNLGKDNPVFREFLDKACEDGALVLIYGKCFDGHVIRKIRKDADKKQEDNPHV